VRVRGDEDDQSITGDTARDEALTICYALDYGPDSPITPQECRIRITPESFLKELAWSRTFVLEQEAHALRSQGYGKRTTARDLLIFGSQGVIDNELRAPNECARHKALDCLGDLALIGCDLHGTVEAYRSGHTLNAELVRRVKLAHAEDIWPQAASRAA
jgi:UDP-3-O-acyl-N-acetylglucosamine deacetylase